MGRPYPSLDHLWIRHSLFGNIEVQMLSPSTFKALMMLVFYSGADRVWTMTEPRDGSLPTDDVLLARLSFTSLRRWKKVKPEIVHFFKEKNGKWYLKEDWILIGPDSRNAIPSSAKRLIDDRHEPRCSYCGRANVPLEYDHIFPVALGGPDDASNLTLACARCNRSKGKKTLWEWLNGRR